MKKIMVAVIGAAMFVCFVFVGIVGAGQAFAYYQAYNAPMEKSMSSSERALLVETRKLEENFLELEEWSHGWLYTEAFEADVVDDDSVRVFFVLKDIFGRETRFEEIVDSAEISAANDDFEELYSHSFEAVLFEG